MGNWEGEKGGPELLRSFLCLASTIAEYFLTSVHSSFDLSGRGTFLPFQVFLSFGLDCLFPLQPSLLNLTYITKYSLPSISLYPHDNPKFQPAFVCVLTPSSQFHLMSPLCPRYPCIFCPEALEGSRALFQEFEPRQSYHSYITVHAHRASIFGVIFEDSNNSSWLEDANHKEKAWLKCLKHTTTFHPWQIPTFPKFSSE